MKQVASLSEMQMDTSTFVAVGVFDGVHLGHKALLSEMVAEAHTAGARAAVLTFYPHPKVITHGLSGRIYLTSLTERLRLLEALGLDLAVVQPFTEAVRQTTAEAFVSELVHQLHMEQIWGGDFGLGRGREGSVPVLQALGREMGFSVHQFQRLVTASGERVSSTRIRQALAEGDVADAAACLGRLFTLEGEVVVGDQRGRTIGFPTANLVVDAQQILPANGVYATYATLGDQRYPAATNIGVRPTVDGFNQRVEAHLLDYSGDIYGQTVRLSFVQRVRAEQKFSGLEALMAQIAADVAHVRALLE